jgi:hypothetical protein
MENMSDCHYSLTMPEKPPAPSNVADKFMLRLPDGVRDRIAGEAEKNKRSMNAEIVARLEKSFAASSLDGNPMVDQEFVKGALDWVLKSYAIENNKLVKRIARVQRAKKEPKEPKK